jgi:hypothetical protein
VASRLFRFTGSNDLEPTFTFGYKTQESMHDFRIRFNEYYIDASQQPEWTLEHDETKMAVTLTYKTKHDNRITAKAQAQLDLKRIDPHLLDCPSIAPLSFFSSPSAQCSSASCGSTVSLLKTVFN